ncbi:MAG: CheR family methyltransferase [Candidatus Rifleibacteriota bacterium]
MQKRFSQKDLREFSSYLSHEYGLSFGQEKFKQLENRLAPLIQKFECRTLHDIILGCKANINLRRELLNVLTTNETWFFRHPAHHKILTDHVLPELIKKAELSRDNRLKVWSAGCSTGAELFSIMITIFEYLNSPSQWNLSFLGSDISSEAIFKAQKGIFNAHEIRYLSNQIKTKYFTRYDNDLYQLKPELLYYVDFEVLNLLDNWPVRDFDIIFCRNVMIYFNETNKKRVTEKILSSLNENGYFFTSANESIHWETNIGLNKIFLENEYIYQKSEKKESRLLYLFATPNDLLRGINLLNQCGIEYQLKRIKQKHELAPKRALSILQSESNRADELFLLSSIKVSAVL